MNGVATIIYMFITLGLMRKTMKLMVFNNYKKSAYDTKGRYIALFVISVLFAAFTAIVSSINNGTPSGDAIVPALLPALLTTLPYLFAMVGICVGGSINEKETAKVEYVEIDDGESEENEDVAETEAEAETQAETETPVVEEAPNAEIAATEETAEVEAPVAEAKPKSRKKK